MFTVSILVWFFTSPLLLIGLINPKWLGFLKVPPKRRKVLLFVGIPWFFFLCLAIKFTPNTTADNITVVQTQANKGDTIEKQEIKKEGDNVNYDANGNILDNAPLFKEFTSYETSSDKPEFENLKGHYYGVYINLPKDTTGISEKLIEYLHRRELKDGEATNIYFFTDSTVIPKRFEGEWITPKISRKCFAWVIRSPNGNEMVDYDEFDFKR